MKPVATKDLLNSGRTDHFSKAVESAQVEAERLVRKTFTLRKVDVDQINAAARRMSEQEQRLVNASEALRSILKGART